MKITTKTFIYFMLICYAFVNIYPIFWMIMNSVKTNQEVALHPFAFPRGVEISNYVYAWKSAKLGLAFMNSSVIAIISTVATVFLGALISFFLARFYFRGKAIIYSYLMFGMLIPIQATLVPIFLLENNLGIMNSQISLFFPYVAFSLPITVFILVSFMSAFHRDIEESAIIDGCGIFQMFRSVILPMTRPALATVIILVFIGNWNEFVFALVLVNDSGLKTLPLAISTLVGQFTTNVSAQMAGMAIALIPTIIMYLFLQNQLVKGMTAGAVKG